MSNSKKTIRETFNEQFAEEWEQPLDTVRYGDDGEKNTARFIYDNREEYMMKTQTPLFRSISQQLKEGKIKFYLYYLEKFYDGYHFIPIYCPVIDLCIGFDKELLFLPIGVTPSKEILYKSNHKHVILFVGNEKNIDIIEKINNELKTD